MLSEKPTFKTDRGGFAFACDDIKLGVDVSSWKKHLTQLRRQSGIVRVVTNLLPDLEYISGIIEKHPENFFLIANTAARAEAEFLKSRFPAIRISLHDKSNAKLVLIAPRTVWMCTNDFGKSPLLESSVGFHSVRLHDHLASESFTRLWDASEELP